MKELVGSFGAKLEILALPSMQFGGQELPTDAEVVAFAKKAGFVGTLLNKGDVNGDGARATYKVVRSATGLGDIKWNFMGKFLVSADGEISLTEDPAADLAKMLG